MVERQARPPLSVRITEFGDVLKGRTYGKEPKLSDEILTLWAGKPTTVRASAVNGIARATVPETPVEFALGIREFADSMRKKVGTEPVSDQQVDIFLATEPKSYQSAYQTPVPPREIEHNYARHLLATLDTVADDAINPPQETDTPVQTLDELRLEAALLVGQIDHLATGLNGNRSVYNTQARLDMVRTLVRVTMRPDDQPVEAEPKADAAPLPAAEETPAPVDPGTIQANRALLRKTVFAAGADTTQESGTDDDFDYADYARQLQALANGTIDTQTLDEYPVDEE